MIDVNMDNLSRIFVEQTAVGIGWTDNEGKVKYLNPALTQMLALDNPEEAYDHPVFTFYEPEAISKLENEILTTVMDKGIWVGKLPLKTKKGDVYMTTNHLFAMKDDSGNLFSFGNVVILTP